MKKFIIKFLIFCLILLIIGITVYKFNDSKEENKNVIKVAEVTHSAFYAPLYVAIENGYFKKEGLDISLILTSGADKVSAAVMSGDVEIGLAGAESAIYVYKGGEKNYLQIFSGLTKRDGQFIISRNDEKDFDLNFLVGKEILVGRKGGMPALNFLNALKNYGVDPNSININYSVDFSALGGTFISGVGDYVNLFEPTATSLVREDNYYIVGSIGMLSGEMPYTAFYAQKDYILNNKEIIKKFTNAINEGILYVKSHEAKDVARVILPQFSNISLDDLEKIVDNYKRYDSWLENPFVSESLLVNLENIMIDNGLLDKYVPYADLVNNFYE